MKRLGRAADSFTVFADILPNISIQLMERADVPSSELTEGVQSAQLGLRVWDSSADICTMHIKNSQKFAAVAIHLLKGASVAQRALIAHRLLTCMAVQFFSSPPLSPESGIPQRLLNESLLRIKYDWSQIKAVFPFHNEFIKRAC